MVRTYSFFEARFRNPKSLLNIERTKTRIDLKESLANLRRPSYQRYLSQNMKILSTSELLAGERDFTDTPVVAVYVMLPSGIVNMECELVVNPDDLINQLTTLDSVNADGVAVNIWWGIVEARKPRQYNWEGYKQLFRRVHESGIKHIQVVLCFHECGGNVGDDAHIPLPKWIKEIGEANPDIYFTDREGRRNHEALTWGIDGERVLGDRTAVEVYSDFMRSFRDAFDEFFEDNTIFEVEIGLGACGELRYPSHSAKRGWEHPGIGEFQCYDKYLRKSLEKAAEAEGHDSSWGRPPDNAGSYNSQPQDTEFFRDGGEYDSAYGRFFLKWYSQYLVDHGDRVLAAANLALKGANNAAKLSGMHWWYETASHAVEGTAGFPDGCYPVAVMLRNHRAALNLTCVIPEGFAWQLLNAAWIPRVRVAGENALVCYDRQEYRKILEFAKPRNDPWGRHLTSFTYRGLNQTLLEQDNLREFALFVKQMHAMMEPGQDDTIALDRNQCGGSRAARSKKRKSSMS